MKYTLIYEKTYFSPDLTQITGHDTYTDSITASSIEEAKESAIRQLQIIDMKSSYRTDIGKAVLVTPEGEEIKLLSAR